MSRSVNCEGEMSRSSGFSVASYDNNKVSSVNCEGEMSALASAQLFNSINPPLALVRRKQALNSPTLYPLLKKNS